MYSMKQACERTGLTYETLKFYCNEGLVPNVKRSENNHRQFDDRDVAWIRSLICLKNCGMSLGQMKRYMALCLVGRESIPERKEMLAAQRALLLERIGALQSAVDFVDQKQQFYDDVLAGQIPYTSNLIDISGNE